MSAEFDELMKARENLSEEAQSKSDPPTKHLSSLSQTLVLTNQ